MKMNKNQKEKIIDWIVENYYDKNFGSISKKDYETFLFAMYLDNKKINNEAIDDFSIGKELGMTIRRVRTLKERKHLKYPDEDYDWIKSFSQDIKNARYDDRKKLVKVAIGDVNVLKDVRNYIDIKGWYDEYQLNSKLLQCPSDVFIELCLSLSNDNQKVKLDEKTISNLEKIKKESKKDVQNGISKILKGSIQDGLSDIAKKGSKELLSLVLKTIPFGGIVKDIIDAFVEVIDNS